MSSHAGTSSVVAEISERVAAMAAAARRRGEQVLAPLLLLGTCERVGSNWVSDCLRLVLGQHNEPFRQQLGPDHPWSALNPDFTDPEATALGGLSRQWLVSSAVAKYGPARQVVKETNLFFALPSVLALLPGAPVLVLSRSILGVASSFARGDLFQRWDYRSRYQQMIAMTQHGTADMRRLAPLVPDNDPPDLVALARLQVLNTVLMVTTLNGRDIAHISYERAVTQPVRALGAISGILPDLCGQVPDLNPQPRAGSACESTFATTIRKTALTAAITPAEAAVISAAKTASLAIVGALLPAEVAATAEAWLSGDHLYRLEPRQPAAKIRKSHPVVRPESVAVCYVRRGGLEVRNLLVSNAEYADFLNALADEGMPNGHDGVWLLTCRMPHERGGRLHLSEPAGRWTVSPGYEDYPVYWVTWIGAAAFATWSGARLPVRAELIQLTVNTASSGNAAYTAGDVTPVTEPGLTGDAIHHATGNLQLWCADGPEMMGGPVTRWLYGTAWNTPGSREAAQRLRSRHILGCSRGIGIRLVRDGAQRAVSAAELARRLATWIGTLDDRARSLDDIDEQLIQTLDDSQPDVRLGSLIAARAGESRSG